MKAAICRLSINSLRGSMDTELIQTAISYVSSIIFVQTAFICAIFSQLLHFYCPATSSASTLSVKEIVMHDNMTQMLQNPMPN